ncbi:MAG: hypothetical protein ACLQIQ_12335 [Beijerinckiaceae bacterium]
MLRQRVRRAIALCSILCLLALNTNTGVVAADLDAKGPRLWNGNGGFVPAHRGCRRIPFPQFDLWGQVAIYVPTWVCLSRGLYADTFDPPPQPR